jgi:hypothetical protein
MGDSGNPTDGTPQEPDPDQPGWASPNPPPAPEPTPPSAAPWGTPPPAAPDPPAGSTPAAPPPPQPAAPPAWGTPPPPAAPGPPAGTPGWGQPGGAPPKKRRLTWLWLLIPLMAVLVAATVVAGIFGVKLFTAPVDATNGYYADLSAGRYDQAYARLCSPAQRAFSESRFVQSQERDERAQGRISSYDFDDVELGDDNDFDTGYIDATVKGTVVRDGRSTDVIVGLRHEDGDWHVCATARR